MDDKALAEVLETVSGQRTEREFRTLTPHEQRHLLVSLIERGRSDEEIGQIIGLSQWQVRNLRYRLGIKKDRGGNVYLESPERQMGRTTTTTIPGTSPGPSPFSLLIHGTFGGEQLTRRLEGLRALFEATDSQRQFQVHIELTEVASEPNDPAAGRKIGVTASSGRAENQ